MINTAMELMGLEDELKKWKNRFADGKMPTEGEKEIELKLNDLLRAVSAELDRRG